MFTSWTLVVAFKALLKLFRPPWSPFSLLGPPMLPFATCRHIQSLYFTVSHLIMHFFGGGRHIELSLFCVFYSVKLNSLSSTKADCIFSCFLQCLCNNECWLRMNLFFGKAWSGPASITVLGVLIWTYLSSLYLEGQNSSYGVIYFMSPGP